MARRFDAGASMWCVAPSWPEHGRHVAVEFVHPVVMGSRALPATSVASSDPVPVLRTDVRTGDIIVLIGPGSCAASHDVARRAPAWGATTIWLGAGDRPEEPVDHLLWLDDDGQTARHDGRLVLRYHLLWELTHICFEHPGLLTSPDECVDDVCITCGDVAHLGEVAEVLADGLATMITPNGPETVETTLVGEVEVGDLVLVHAGTAIERVECR